MHWGGGAKGWTHHTCPTDGIHLSERGGCGGSFGSELVDFLENNTEAKVVDGRTGGLATATSRAFADAP